MAPQARSVEIEHGGSNAFDDDALVEGVGSVVWFCDWWIRGVRGGEFCVPAETEIVRYGYEGEVGVGAVGMREEEVWAALRFVSGCSID